MRRHLRTAAALASAFPLAASASCSCSPTSYSFTVSFDGTCEDSSGFGGGGVDGSICFYTRGGDPEGVDGVGFGGTVGEGESITTGDEVEEPPGRRHRRGLARDRLGGADLTRQADHAARRASEHYQLSRQGLDTTPTVVTSVTFLEADTTPGLSIINQDSTYFDSTITDGQVLTYESVSANLDPDVPLEDQMDSVPGGVMLVLFGVNAEGQVVQNTVAWGYDADACEEPFDGEANIGWLELGSYESASEVFCPATAVTTTAAPTTTAAATTAAATTTAATTTAAATTTWSAPMSMPKSGKAKGSSKGDHSMSVAATGKSSKMLGGAKSSKRSEGGGAMSASKGGKREFYPCRIVNVVVAHETL